MKNLLGTAIIAADIFFGAAAPEVFRNLHKETHAHLYGSVGLYIALVVLTLWVIASVVQRGPAAGGAANQSPARAPYSSFRQPGGRR